jgi:hypothetical protein
MLHAESASRTDTHSEDAVLRLGHLWGVADNVADTNPLTAADITNLLAAAFGRWKLHPSGALIFPRDAHLYHRSHRLDSSRFALASGWAPAHGPFPAPA